MSPGADPPSQAFFVGRETELALLDRLIARAGAGTARTVLVQGEAGVGKSRLLREFADRVRASGARVLLGSCVPLGAGELPYAPLIDALRRLVRSLGEPAVRKLGGDAYANLANLVTGLPDAVAGPQPEPTSRLRVFGAVLRLLDRLGADGPVLLVFEDLQWADPSTLDLVAYLAQAITDERVLLVCSYRSSELAPRHPLRTLVAELELARRLQRVEVARFTRSELGTFLGFLLGDEPGRDLVERAFTLSDGNAFFAEELVVAGVVGSSGPAPARLPGSLRDLVLARFQLLGDDSREVMRVAATAGRRVSHRLLSAVCELPQRRMLAALRECVAHQMLVTDAADDTYVFRHALLREAVHEELLPGERQRLHASVAAALTADAGLSYAEQLTVAAELSYHWYEAGVPDEALAAAVRAGDIAIRVRAFPEAAQQYQRALELWPRVGDAVRSTAPRERLLVSAAEAARWAGYVERAVELVRAALSEVDAGGRPERAGELFERLGSYRWEAGDSAGARDAYEQAARLLAGQPPTAVTARVHAALATADVRAGHYAEGLRRAEEAVVLARSVGATAEEGRALNTTGVALSKCGRSADGVEALRAALRIAEETDHLEDLYRAYGNLTLVLEVAGRLEESVRVALDGLDRARRLGLEYTRGGGVLANNASAALVLLGRWDEAASIIADVIRNRPAAETLYPRLTLAEIEVARGRFAQAERLLATVRAAGRDVREPEFVGALHACLAELALWRRRYDAARAAVADGLAAIGAAESMVELLRLYALAARIEADECLRPPGLRAGTGGADDCRGAVDSLRRAVDRIDASHGRSFVPEARALHLLCRAECDRGLGAADAARWAELAATWDAHGRPYPAAYARWREGAAAVGARDGAAATRALRAAHRVALSLGAGPLRAELEALARHERIDLTEPDSGSEAPQPSTPARPSGLTKREWTVLRHLCAGRSNRQIGQALFISEKTAGVHVSNILRKLDVPNRGGAAALAHQLGWFPDQATSEERTES